MKHDRDNDHIDDGFVTEEQLMSELLNGPAVEYVPAAPAASTAEPRTALEQLLTNVENTTIETYENVLQRLLAAQFTPAHQEVVLKAVQKKIGVNLATLKAEYRDHVRNADGDSGKTGADQLIAMLLNDHRAELTLDDVGAPWVHLVVDDKLRSHPVNSQHLRTLVAALSWNQTLTPVKREALLEVITTLEGIAVYGNQHQSVHVRVAALGSGADTKIYLDIADEDFNVYEISASGVKTISSLESPVRFHRVAAMESLPRADLAGTEADLVAALGMPTHDDDGQYNPTYLLGVSHLLTFFRPDISCPMAILKGEQGAGKSSFGRACRSLTDPSAIPLEAPPRNEDDLIVTMQTSAYPVYDNREDVIPAWESNALCRIVDGSGSKKRRLYTDSDVHILKIMRPIMQTGITDYVKQPDLIDRSIALIVNRVPDSQRLTDEENKTRLLDARPKALGYLLSVVAAGLARNTGQRRIPNPPRMASYAEWIACCAPELHWNLDEFLEAYGHSQQDLLHSAQEAEPILQPLVEFANSQKEWIGSATELLTAITKMHGYQNKETPDGWPPTPEALVVILKKHATNLLGTQGIDVTQLKRSNKGRRWKLMVVSDTPPANDTNP